MEVGISFVHLYQEKLCAAPGPGVASVNLALHLVCSFTIVVLCLSGVCVRLVYPNTLQSCLHSTNQRMQTAHFPDSATQNRSTDEE